MSRIYFSWPITQLEAEFERAQDAGDKAAISRVASELGFRTTSKARALRRTVEAFLGTDASSKRNERKYAEPSRDIEVVSKGVPSGQRGHLTKRPTEEQQEAVSHFLRGGSLKINAYAGTGKTSTLELLAHSTTKQGQYIAFNTSIVRDAEKRFPKSVHCSTVHSLAYRASPSGFKSNPDKMTKRLNANQLAEILGFKRWSIDSKHALQPRSQAYLVLETLRRFMQSSDVNLKEQHVPRHGALISAPEQTMKEVAAFTMKAANCVWDRMKVKEDPMPLGHDGYLKLWALTDPVIAGDFILLDEAQDTNSVVLEVLRKQPAQMIYVGDKYQQIYEWRGAVNAMEKVDTNNETYLTTSFRFGAAIADAASRVLRLLGEQRPLKGNPSITSRIGHVAKPRANLARTNASTISSVIETLDLGIRPHLVGGTKELMDLLRGVQDLKEGRQSTVSEFFGFEDWAELVGFAKSDEGSHLLSFVNLVEARGERQLMWALGRTVDEENSNLTISTAHKAKGREWTSVSLADDFVSSKARKPLAREAHVASGHDPAELRLLYVALTRAKHEVSVPEKIVTLLGLRQ